MQIDRLQDILSETARTTSWLDTWGIRDPQRAASNLNRLRDHGFGWDLLAVVVSQLETLLPECSDPDRALNNLERFVAASLSPLGLGALFERDPTALPILVRIFSTSQHFSDLLIREPEGFDLLRLTEGQPVAREMLVEDIVSEVGSLRSPPVVMAALRRFKHREMLRIAYGDLVGKQRIEVITRQISYVAEAICQAAVRFSREHLEDQWGTPLRADGTPAQLAVLALGKLGGEELNYSSDIDLIFVYDLDGQTNGTRHLSNVEFFDRQAKFVVKMLTEATDLGAAYRVDLRLRPHGRTGPTVQSLAGMLQYYDDLGRTWERQAFVKARGIAGDLELAQKLLSRLEPWVYARYLSLADISGIKVLKRRIETQSSEQGKNHSDVKTGSGGIRDIEFTIQFLQLLNGGELPAVRGGNTLEAIDALADAGCLTHQERTLLSDNYAFLRHVEHRLQIMFDLQTHQLPADPAERTRLAKRLDYPKSTGGGGTALEQFSQDLAECTKVNRKILNFLLHDAFTDQPDVMPEADLILAPDLPAEEVERMLSRHGFQDSQSAYRHLIGLGQERIPFLSTRRCRHFLAAITPALLAEVGQTTDPDQTLITLSNVSDSLGGKAVLWELFSYHPLTLQLYVRLCATSPYLSSILTSQPGMIDELMDSLLLNRLPSRKGLEANLRELCRGVEEIDPSLHAFKNAQHLRVGVLDVLGKEDVRATHQTLAEIAEVVLQQATDHEFELLRQRYGSPTVTREAGASDCEFVILAMGKLGGREPNYHSDLDVVFLYEADGKTAHRRSERATTNQHFFTELASRVMKRLNQVGPYGRLYEVDARLRPTGRSGSLVLPLSEFERYFHENGAQLWERQALTKARPVYGGETFRRRVSESVKQAIFGLPWSVNHVDEIVAMRQRLEESASPHNLKRGYGGTVDVEFAVQMMQLRFGSRYEAVMKQGTLEAIESLAEQELLDEQEAQWLHDGYRFLRSVEARLRLMNTTARHDLPTESEQLERLAYFLRYESAAELQQDIVHFRTVHRNLFERIAQRLRQPQ